MGSQKGQTGSLKEENDWPVTSVTRVVFEGEDALKDAAMLLSSRTKDQTVRSLHTLVETLASASGDLSSPLEDLLKALQQKSRSELRAQVEGLGQGKSETFVAGVLAGLALGVLAERLGQSPQGLTKAGEAPKAADVGDDVATDSHSPGPAQDRHARKKTGIASTPIKTAQTSAGGLGYLLAATPEDESVRRPRSPAQTGGKATARPKQAGWESGRGR